MENIILVVLGIVCIVLGIENRKGNINSVHTYHRKRVSEEDKVPFGNLIGIGMLIIGVSVILSAILNFVSVIFQQDIYYTIAECVTIIGVVIGLGFNLYAMFKYNKGIF